MVNVEDLYEECIRISSGSDVAWMDIYKSKKSDNLYYTYSEVNGYLSGDYFSKKELKNYIMDLIDYSSDPKAFMEKLEKPKKKPKKKNKHVEL